MGGERYFSAPISEDLAEKMVLLSGPRQVGKSTLALRLVASQLLKLCHFVEDTEGHRMELRFLRDTDGREVDFVVLRDRKPWLAVEVKSGERAVSPAIRYFRERTSIPRWFQVHRGAKDVVVDGVRVLPFAALVRELDLP